jgi:prolyl 4-hydroxylase
VQSRLCSPRVLIDTSAMSQTDLRHYIRTYERALDPALCTQMIDSFNTLARFQARNGRGVRAGLEDSAWTELNVSRMSDAGFRSMFRKFIDEALARYNRDVGLTIPVPNSPLTSDLILKRYQPGSAERFQLHFDAIHHVAHRYMVLLWYLNDVTEGGETRFPQLEHSVRAQAGTLLMFPPYWMYQHEGATPRSGDKYILSTYLLFTASPSNPTAAGMAAE